MRLIKLFIILFFVFGVCFFANSESKKSSLIKEEVLLNELPKELTKLNIWYELDEKGVLTFYVSDMGVINKVMTSLVDEIIPMNRSFNPISIEQENCLVEFFRKNKIPFTFKVFNNETWLVLEKDSVDNYLGVCVRQK